MIASIFRRQYGACAGAAATSSRQPGEQRGDLRLREEVKELKERLKVLERITVEKENSLAKEIE